MAGRVGNRVRRGVAGTAVAATAMAALTASQAPGVVAHAPANRAAEPGGPTISGDSPYRTELPPLRALDRPGPGSDRTSPRPLSTGDAAVPATVLDAYRRAEATLAASAPQCNLPWELLAAIGQVESGHARGGQVTEDGTTRAPILGPRLDGNGFATIRDTDGGVYDGDVSYDRAVGPMQFIPSTWASWGADGNGDGRADPDNVYDAALAAGRYLCAGGRDLSDPGDLDRAILGYNRSTTYLHTVKSWLTYFRYGHREVPDATGTSSSPERERERKPERTGSARPGPTPSAESEESRRPGPGRATSPSSPEPEESRNGDDSDGPRVSVPDVEEDLSGIGEDALPDTDRRGGTSTCPPSSLECAPTTP